VCADASKNFHPPPAVVIALFHLAMRLRSTTPCFFAAHFFVFFFPNRPCERLENPTE
jgi:hypothetical protein